MRKQSHRRRRVSAAARRINEEVEHARRIGRCIDDLTAKRIACELDPGNGSLHELAETGAIAANIEVDLSVAEEVAMGLELAIHIPWVAALRQYCNRRLLKSCVPYWGDLDVG